MGGLTPTAPDWLSQLAPDHAPAPVSAWPPAPGWWALAFLLLSAAAAILVWWMRPQRRLRRAVLRDLAQLERSVADDAALAQQIEQLLRRFALRLHGRESIAGLTGEAWIAFVVARGGSDWDGEAGRSLLCLAYGGRAPAHRQAWLRGARAFVKAGRRR